MKPSEVIAMRDLLAERLLAVMGLKNNALARDISQKAANWLIKSGWVVAPPKSEKQEDCGKVFRTYEFSYTCPKRKGHEGGCDD